MSDADDQLDARIVSGIPDESLPHKTNVYSVTVDRDEFEVTTDGWLQEDEFHRWPRGFFIEKIDYLPYTRLNIAVTFLGFVMVTLQALLQLVTNPNAVSQSFLSSPIATTAVAVLAILIGHRFVSQAHTIWSTVLFYTETVSDDEYEIVFGRRPTTIGLYIQRLLK